MDKPKIDISTKFSPVTLEDYDKLTITIKIDKAKVNIDQVQKLNKKLFKLLKRELYG
jgi:hypothetical protein